VRFGFALPAYGPGAEGAVVADLVAAGEELGFETIWLPDHIAVPDYATEVNLDTPFLEPLAACGWGLGATRRVRFGTDVLVAGYRHPLQVAAMAGTLGRLAPDRLVLGVGIGYLRGEFEVLGVPYESRAADTEEWIRRLRQPPAGFSVVDAPTPAPIWVGGNNVRALERAALLGDGWHPLWVPPDAYRAQRQVIVDRRAAAGLTGPFTFSFSAGTTRVLDQVPPAWPELPPKAPAESEFSYAPAPWADAEGRPGLMGTPDQVVSDLVALADAGVEQITLRFGSTEVADLERFAQLVMPAFA
jgi:alkanesulfonate monooxygenase SsuD/methylene tetrahydromethanopterin reductase-like flavin-dependent oxidoreductase (luciferase family)